MARSSILFFFLFIKTFLFAQEKQTFVLEARTFAMIHKPLTSEGFTKTFEGTYTAGVDLNVSIIKNFSVGLMYSNSMLSVPRYSVNTDTIITTKLMYNMIGLKLGYTQHVNDFMFVTYSLAGGQNIANYYDLVFKKPEPVNPNFSTSFIQGSVQVCFMVEDRIGLGLNVAYTRLNYAFNPSDVYLNQYFGYKNDNLTDNITSLDYGFSIFIGIVKKKNKS